MDTPLTLLLVDGHQGVREALARRLSHATGVGAVVVAGDLESAVVRARALAPDAIVCDPKTLLGSAQAVLAGLSGTHRPVVVLTSSLLDGEESTLRCAGAAAVFLKGCPVAELLAGIGAARHAHG